MLEKIRSMMPDILDSKSRFNGKAESYEAFKSKLDSVIFIKGLTGGAKEITTKGPNASSLYHRLMSEMLYHWLLLNIHHKADQANAIIRHAQPEGDRPIFELSIKALTTTYTEEARTRFLRKNAEFQDLLRSPPPVKSSAIIDRLRQIIGKSTELQRMDSTHAPTAINVAEALRSALPIDQGFNGLIETPSFYQETDPSLVLQRIQTHITVVRDRRDPKKQGDHPQALTTNSRNGRNRVARNHATSNAPPNPNNCSYCNKPNHKKAECRWKKKNEANNSGATCKKCGSKDHMAPACNKPSKDTSNTALMTLSASAGTKPSKATPTLSDRTQTLPPSIIDRLGPQVYVRESSDEEPRKRYILSVSDRSRNERDLLVLDTGATNHVVNDRSLFSTYTVIPAQSDLATIHTAGESVQALGIGTVTITMNDHVRRTLFQVDIADCLHVPAAPYHLLSFTQIKRNSTDVHMRHVSEGLLFGPHQGTNILARLDATLRLFTVWFRRTRQHGALTITNFRQPRADWHIFHMRTGHSGNTAMTRLANEYSIDIAGTRTRPTCNTCLATKSQVHPHSSAPANSTATAKNHRWCLDMAGPIYGDMIFGLTDEYTDLDWHCILEDKCADTLLQAFKDVVDQQGTTPQFLRLDNDPSFMSSFLAYRREHNIQDEFIVPFESYQNGLRERHWRTLFQKIRAALNWSGLPPEHFWRSCLMYMTFVINRIPSGKNAKAPADLHGLEMRLDDIRTWGCTAWVHRTKNERATKLSDTSIPMVFLGLARNARGFLVYHPSTKRTLVRRNIIFDELAPGGQLLTQSPPSDTSGHSDNFGSNSDSDSDDDTSPSKHKVRSAIIESPIVPVNADTSNNVSAEPIATLSEPDFPTDDDINNYRQTLQASYDVHRRANAIAPRKSDRDAMRHFQEKLDDLQGTHPVALPPDEADTPDTHTRTLRSNTALAAIAAASSGVFTPDTYAQARKCPESHLWEQSMRDEIHSLLKADTFLPVDALPDGRKAISSKYNYKVKLDAAGNVNRHKSRVVARGFTQQFEIDYFLTYSPVTKTSTILTLIALGSANGFIFKSIDVSNAYVQADPMEEEIYITPPPGWVEFGGPTCAALRVIRPLYGLKQSGRHWYQAHSKFLTNYGFHKSILDPCLFYLLDDANNTVGAISVYVDDTLSIWATSKHYDDFYAAYSTRFAVKRQDLSFLLGINIDITESSVNLSQVRYIESMLKRYDLLEAKPYATPLTAHEPLSTATPSPSTEEHDYMQHVPYRSIIGSLNYASVSTRLDISHAVSRLSSFLMNPARAHWEAAKHILRYLSGTKNHGLRFPIKPTDMSQALTLYGYVDASYASDQDDTKSYTGYVFLLNDTPIVWTSKRQTYTTTSSTEAEIAALYEACREAIALRNLLAELRFTQTSATKIYCDNKQAILFAKDDHYRSTLRHMPVKMQFVKEHTASGEIEPIFTPTAEQAADHLTKSVSRAVLERNLRLLNFQ